MNQVKQQPRGEEDDEYEDEDEDESVSHHLDEPGVNKLTIYFNNNPTRIREWLNSLGYGRYANIAVEADIGILELNGLTEERLRRMGLPSTPTTDGEESAIFSSGEEGVEEIQV